MIRPIAGSMMKRTYETGKSIYRRFFQGMEEKDESEEEEVVPKKIKKKGELKKNKKTSRGRKNKK